MNPLLDIVHQHKAGQHRGVYSVCSAHPLVLEAAMRLARARGECALIEATANQVNQFGGYTGLTPAQCREQLLALAHSTGLPAARLVLGGDHLGPVCWRAEPAALALERAATMVEAYVRAGFRKIHLDCSMGCADDPAVLADEQIAERAAALAAAAERAWRASGGEPPVYVIGTEVPTPGGAAESLHTLAVTTGAAVDQTLSAHREAFAAHGLAVWERVIALVVQPGVEFDHDRVIDYEPAKARALSARIEREPTLVYEAHSTDYQRPAALRALVADHFAILKVGPAATFALREALWALADIGRELALPEAAAFKPAVLAAMRADPRHWRAYYTDAARESFDLQFSLSDRIRYYWATGPVQAASHALLAALTRVPIPYALLSQYLPQQAEAVRAGALAAEPRALALAVITRLLIGYAEACTAARGHA